MIGTPDRIERRPAWAEMESRWINGRLAAGRTMVHAARMRKLIQKADRSDARWQRFYQAVRRVQQRMTDWGGRRRTATEASAVSSS